MSWSSLRNRMRTFAETRAGKLALKVIRWTFVAGILGFLGLQLTSIGWEKVWQSLPRTAWFYVLWAAIYLQLPLVEALIYRALWGLPLQHGLPVLLRKRVLNTDVVGYSGDVYLYAWAQQVASLPKNRVLGAVKDNAIASSLGSTLASILMLVGFLFAGEIALVDLIDNQDPLYAVGGIVLVVVVVTLLLVFRRTVFSLSLHEVLGLFGTHVGRMAGVFVLQILQWWVVFPEAPFQVWATMLAVMIVTTRVPLMPAKDLAAMGAILGITDLLAAPEAVIAGLLIARSALDRITNFVLFGVSTLWERVHSPNLTEEVGEADRRAPGAGLETGEAAVGRDEAAPKNRLTDSVQREVKTGKKARGVSENNVSSASQLPAYRRSKAEHQPCINISDLDCELDTPTSMSSKEPTVSCLLVTAGRPQLIKRALRGYQQQTYDRLELIVLDNGQEPVEETVRSFELPGTVRYFHVNRGPNMWIGGLRNQALDKATGEFVIPQWDDDDWSHPKRIERQVGVLQRGYDVCTLQGTLMHVDHPDYFHHPFIGVLPNGVPPTMMHRRDAAIRYPNIRRTSDTDYLNDWREKRHVILPREDAYLYLRYSHDGNLWETDHFLRRMRNTPTDLFLYAWHRYVRGDVFGHPRFQLTEEMEAAFEQYLADSFRYDLFEHGPADAPTAARADSSVA